MNQSEMMAKIERGDGFIYLFLDASCGFAATTFRGHLFVERIIEQHDFARDSFTRHRFQFIKIFDHKDLGFDPLLWCSHTVSQRAQDNLLSSVRCLSGKLNKRCCLFAAHPMRHHDFLELHVAADCFQFGGHVLD